jgi:SAM-dependent methyltransferase
VIDLETYTRTRVHVRDDRVLVREVARLLRPGGLWYVGTILRGERAWWFYRGGGVRRLDPLLGVGLRALGRTGIVRGDKPRNAYRAGVPERLGALKLRVLGYHEVADHKRPYPPRA